MTSLSKINRIPQGAPQIDTQTYPDDCDPTHPFHFDFYLASNLVNVNYAKLSFFLRAFRSPVAATNNPAVTSGSSSASSSGSSSASSSSNGDVFHSHTTDLNVGAGAAGTVTAGTGPSSSLWVSGIAAGSSVPTNSVNGTHAHDIPHDHGIPHDHSVTSDVTLTYGIFEGAVATGVTVKVNGVDRTSALGGGTGFTTNQTELALDVAWLNQGAWNTIDLTPTSLGRILGHLTVVSYIQSN